MISVKYYANGLVYDISDLIKSVEWTGDIKQAARSLDIELVNIDSLGWSKPSMTFECGKQIRLYENGLELFRGVVFETNINHEGNQSLKAYDEAKYLVNNADSRVFKNIKASQVVSVLCKEYGIPIGSIEDTGHVIKHLVLREKSLWDAFMYALSITKEETGRKYWIYMKQGHLYLSERKKELVKWTISDGYNLTSSSKRTSIESLRNSIKLIAGDLEDKKKKPVIKTVQDNTSISNYGRMQHVENVGDMKSSRLSDYANKKLKELNKPQIDIDVEVLGYSPIISGKSVYATDKMTGLSGGYYVLQDNHTWDENGVHTMKLTLSVTDELPLEDLSYDELDAANGIENSKPKTTKTTEPTKTTK